LGKYWEDGKEEYGRAGQGQRLEDLLDKNGEDEKGGVKGKEDRSRVWKICWIRIGEDGKEEYRDSRTGTQTGRYVEHG
jgi:hypothetical protein